METGRHYQLLENEPLEGQQRITVKQERDGRAVWTKTRELEDDEIVSTDSMRTPRWTFHRPIRGWYLILQRASPDGSRSQSYIELNPRKRSPSSAAGAPLELEFRVRTPPRAPPSPYAPSAHPAHAGTDSPAVRVDMSPTVEPFLASSAMSPSLSAASAASQTSATEPLAGARHGGPSSSPTHRRSRSSFAREGARTSWEETTFTLRSGWPAAYERARLGHSGGSAVLNRLKGWIVEPPRRFCCVRQAESRAGSGEEEVVVAFEEGSSGFFNPRLSGTLSLAESQIDESGLEPSFWVALACAYIDALEEQDGWEAAKDGD
ncbi:uncharacterized protein JCM10292_004964 [Rhodotorula paludigena]|uniref:uncharacterized protein n=1 Tax=Rhodotorula paludigena TaxID=86838 RepID=UPI0031794498